MCTHELRLTNLNREVLKCKNVMMSKQTSIHKIFSFFCTFPLKNQQQIWITSCDTISFLPKQLLFAGEKKSKLVSVARFLISVSKTEREMKLHIMNIKQHRKIHGKDLAKIWKALCLKIVSNSWQFDHLQRLPFYYFSWSKCSLHMLISGFKLRIPSIQKAIVRTFMYNAYCTYYHLMPILH